MILFALVKKHLDQFKAHTLESVPQLVNHWTIAAFEDNVRSIAKLVVLLRLVSVNVGAIVYVKLLLHSMSASCELSVADVSLMQGVAIVRDSQRGVYVNVVKACGSDAKGTENTFGKVCSEMEAASKKPATGKKFEHSYLFKQPTSGMQGGIKGVHFDLKMLIGIAIDASKNTECLTRFDDGTFCWTARTKNKMEDLTIKNKRFKLVLSMFTLFLNLMLDVTESLSQGSFFEEFIRDYNLQTKSSS